MDGELLQILLQAEKKAQGNAEKLLPDTPRKEEIKEENVLRQKEINILGQWQQASYCWIRFDPWTCFFHSILYIEVLYHFVSQKHEGMSYILYARALWTGCHTKISPGLLGEWSTFARRVAQKHLKKRQLRINPVTREMVTSSSPFGMVSWGEKKLRSMLSSVFFPMH